MVRIDSRKFFFLGILFSLPISLYIQIDHDVCSNYGNWVYVAGVGNDPRENRHFNMIKQAFDYDPDVRVC
jgi:hypothetical protein